MSAAEAASAAPIDERIDEQRDALFGVQAVVGVAAASIDPDKDFDRHRVLSDAYVVLDRIAREFDEIAIAARATDKHRDLALDLLNRTEDRLNRAEVSDALELLARCKVVLLAGGAS